MGRITDMVTGTEAHPEHPIQLTNINEPFICDGCYEPGFGMCYECKEPAERCGNIYHEECAQPKAITSHPFSGGCLFTFEYRRHATSSSTSTNIVFRICDACGTHVKGFHYVCNMHGQERQHFIHPTCMNLKHHMHLQDEGEVQFLLKGTVPKSCCSCGQMNAFEGIMGWSYVRSSDGLCIHVKCVKTMLMDNWKRSFFGDTTSSSAPIIIIGDNNNSAGNGAVVPYAGRRNSTGKLFTRLFSIFRLVFTSVSLVLFGIPTPGDVIIQALTYAIS